MFRYHLQFTDIGSYAFVLSISKLHWAFITAAGVTNISASLSSIIKNMGGNTCKPHIPVHIVVLYQVCTRSFNTACRMVVLL
jgi:ABC-type polysaccharide/polyol phosphate export permease